MLALEGAVGNSHEMERKEGREGGEVGSDAKTILEVVGEGATVSRSVGRSK